MYSLAKAKLMWPLQSSEISKWGCEGVPKSMYPGSHQSWRRVSNAKHVLMHVICRDHISLGMPYFTGDAIFHWQPCQDPLWTQCLEQCQKAKSKVRVDRAVWSVASQVADGVWAWQVSIKQCNDSGGTCVKVIVLHDLIDCSTCRSWMVSSTWFVSSDTSQTL